MKKYYVYLLVMITAFFVSCERGGLENAFGDEAGKKVKVNVKAPQLTFSQLEYDFGQIKPTDTVSHDFKFKNTGKTVLKILNIRSSCGCTTTNLAKKEYAPGESGVITARFNPKNFQGDQVKTITIKSNDPLRSTIVLKIKAHVLVEILMRPTRLYYRDMIIGQPRTTTVSLQGGDIKFFKIKEVIIPEDATYLSYKIKELDDNRRSIYHITFTCDPDENTKQNFAGVVKIVTDSKAKPLINLTFRGNVRGSINYSPRSIGDNVNSPKYFNRTISFSSNIPFKITDVRFQKGNKILKHKLITLATSHSYSIVIYSEEMLSQELRDTLTIQTDSNLQKEIRIPVSIVKK